jgi:hypothetical protein
MQTDTRILAVMLLIARGSVVRSSLVRASFRHRTQGALLVHRK